MKKTILVLLLAAMLALTGCDKDNPKTSAPDTTAPDNGAEKAAEFTLTSDIHSSAIALEDLEYTAVADIDKKYIVEKNSERIFVNSLAEPIELCGLLNPSDNGGEYYRLDSAKKTDYLKELAAMAYTLPSVQIRFCTDAKDVVVRVKLKSDNKDDLSIMSGFAMRGVESFIGTGNELKRVGRVDTMLGEDRLYNTATLPISKDSSLNQVTLYLPIMAGIESLELGFPAGAKIAAPTPRDYGAVCFYGSSITHGICAGAPANNYPSVICRSLNADCYNLGFMGLAQGELEVADFIGRLDIDAFVYDYDYNANSRAALEATHYAFYERVRQLQPDIPIIIMSRPYYTEEPSQNDLDRREIIVETYNKAKSAGDNNVYLIDADSYFPKKNRDLYTSDYLHPNDLGYYSMAQAVYPTLKAALDKNK